jgi:predicted amidophosphoribosyltransferase
MVNVCCRVCGKDLKLMAVCIKCGRPILHGCLKCLIFSDTKIHVDCLSAVSPITQGNDA